ncbi:MAG: VanZ family protein, partial [Actinomycetota bacterium]|nr:VanZ family protein [Actinomycetota bacterium]
ALRPAARAPVALVASLTVSIVYAVSDEIHQTFVPGRSGTPIDVSIDALGASIAALVIRRRERRPAGSG